MSQEAEDTRRRISNPSTARATSLPDLLQKILLEAIEKGRIHKDQCKWPWGVVAVNCTSYPNQYLPNPQISKTNPPSWPYFPFSHWQRRLLVHFQCHIHLVNLSRWSWEPMPSQFLGQIGNAFSLIMSGHQHPNQAFFTAIIALLIPALPPPSALIE